MLCVSGKRDGQTLMVKRGANVEAHQWSAAEQKWMKIGDVVGSSGSSQSTSGKQLYEGKVIQFCFICKCHVLDLHYVQSVM